MKKTLTIFLLLFSFITKAQGVYDDFIYTRKASEKIPNQNAKPIISAEEKTNQLASNIEKLIREGKFKQVEKFLSNEKIILNDAEYFEQQTNEYKPFIPKAYLLDSLNASGNDKNDHSKYMVYYTYSYQQPGIEIFNFRIYLVFHLEKEIVKSMDITFAKLPK
ncbi:MAG: hypothetical protein WCO54_05700 [Bacteroidota bacterium]